MKAFTLSAAASLAAVFALYAPASNAKEARVDPMAAGQQLFERNCIACHGSGRGYPPFQALPGTNALEAKYKGQKPALLSERTDLTPEIVAYFVRNGVSVMAPYRKTELSDTDVTQIGAYLSRRNPEVKKMKK